MQAQMVKHAMEGVDDPSASVMNLSHKATRDKAKSQLSSDVEAFIHLYGIDEKASKALLQEDPAVQKAVLAGGSLKSARNKGASVMGRIKQAKQVLASISQVSVKTGAVEQFIARHDIDDNAAHELRGENPAVQQAVLDSGPLTGVHNPSAVVITRIRKAKQGKLATCQLSSCMSRDEASFVRGAIDEFIAQNGIDDKAAQELLGESLAIQQAVLLCGPLTSCKNPSAVLIGRIRSAKQGKLTTRQMCTPATFDSGTYVNNGASVLAAGTAQLPLYDKEGEVNLEKVDSTISNFFPQHSTAPKVTYQDLASTGKYQDLALTLAKVLQVVNGPDDPEQQSTSASSQYNDDLLSTSSEPSLDLGGEAAIASVEASNQEVSALQIGTDQSDLSMLQEYEGNHRGTVRQEPMSQKNDDDAHLPPWRRAKKKSKAEPCKIVPPPGLSIGPLDVQQETNKADGFSFLQVPSHTITPQGVRKITPPPGLSIGLDDIQPMKVVTCMQMEEAITDFGLPTMPAEEALEEGPAEYSDAETIPPSWCAALGGAGNLGPIRKIPDEYLCVKHWEPVKEIESGLTILHGDRLLVTWTDGCKDGWAYGTLVGDDTKEGYFPQQCLRVLKRSPCNLVLGRKYMVCDHFEAPTGALGYLNVYPEDLVTVLHQDPDANPWIYAKKCDCDEYGWLPEAMIAV